MDSLFDVTPFEVEPAKPAKLAPIDDNQLGLFGEDHGVPADAFEPEPLSGSELRVPEIEVIREPVIEPGVAELAADAHVFEAAIADLTVALNPETAELLVSAVDLVPEPDPLPEPDTSAEPEPTPNSLRESVYEPVVPEPESEPLSLSEPEDQGLAKDPYKDPASFLNVWESVVGQDQAVHLLKSAARNPVHAYLFVGPPGSGKPEAARAFAASLLCPRGGCGLCSVCTRSLHLVHPDVVVVEREGASISVDQAREIIRVAMRTPVEGDRKVIILNDFHLVANAAPTLLKVIEEPPPSTVFVVMADMLSNELVTIASRCLEVRFLPLSLETITQALIDQGVAPDRAAVVAKASGGRLDRARLLIDDTGFLTRQSFWETARQRLDGTGAAVAVLTAEAISMVEAVAAGPLEQQHGAQRKALDERLEVTGQRGVAGLRKELVDRQKREVKRVRDDEIRLGLATLQRELSAQLSQSSRKGALAQSEQIAKAIDAVGEAGDDLNRNPNLALLLASLFLRLPRP